MTRLAEGKKILIMGLRNKWSIAWGIAKKLYEGGAELAFTYQGERERLDICDLLAEIGEAVSIAAGPDGAVITNGGVKYNGGTGGKTTGGRGGTGGEATAGAETGGEAAAGAGVNAGADVGAGAKTVSAVQARAQFPVIKCDLGSDDEIDVAFDVIKKIWGRLDGVVHAVASARGEDLKNPFILTSREGFLYALDISVYTFAYMSRKAAELMQNGGGSIVTLTYMGSERVFPGYNVMGVAKAALEATVRYLAHNLGPAGIRVNAISSGSIKTVSAKAVKNFTDILSVVDEKAPLKRRVDADEIGGAALYFMSDLSTAVTGEVHHVDCGFNIMGI